MNHTSHSALWHVCDDDGVAFLQIELRYGYTVSLGVDSPNDAPEISFNGARFYEWLQRLLRANGGKAGATIPRYSSNVRVL